MKYSQLAKLPKPEGNGVVAISVIPMEMIQIGEKVFITVKKARNSQQALVIISAPRELIIKRSKAVEGEDYVSH